MLKEKLVITAIMGVLLLLDAVAVPWGNGGAEMTREQIVRYRAESVKRANLPPVAKAQPEPDQNQTAIREA